MGSRSQVDRAYDEIKARIVDGRYRAGGPLGESELARTHRASRTPVREALARLLEEGYAGRVAGRGFFVAPITVTLIQNTLDIRRLLEGEAAARASMFATPAEIQRIRALGPVVYVVGDRDSFRQALGANRAFHAAIAAASRNTVLEDLIQRCVTQMERFMSLGVDLLQFQQDATAEHALIVAAIERRDADAARRAVEAHLDACAGLMMRLVMAGDIAGVGVAAAARRSDAELQAAVTANSDAVRLSDPLGRSLRSSRRSAAAESR